MKTVYDQEDILFNLINASVLKTSITGAVLRGEAPPNSPKENIVINSLPISTGDVQEGTSNVNIYVPDVDIVVGGITFKTSNKKRLKQLTELAIPILNDVTNPGYWAFSTVFIGEYADPEAKASFVNFRIDFIFHNN